MSTRYQREFNLARNAALFWGAVSAIFYGAMYLLAKYESPKLCIAAAVVATLFLLVAGFFLPPVAVILMAAPILLPIVTGAGFDPYWFAVVLTINMEIGLITPPVGLNLYVINGIAPDIPLKTILWGSMPFVLCMVLAILLLCLFPQLATALPDLIMGVGQ